MRLGPRRCLRLDDAVAGTGVAARPGCPLRGGGGFVSRGTRHNPPGRRGAHRPGPQSGSRAAIHRLVRLDLVAGRRHQELSTGSGRAPGRYQILAAINAVHTDARDVRDTDWSQVAALYDQLLRLDSSPIVRLNRAIAVAELDGPEVALAQVDGLPLAGYHAFHATRADLLRRLGRSEESQAAYDRAIELVGNTAERAYLSRRRDQLAGP
jgi:hypothetical protein